MKPIEFGTRLAKRRAKLGESQEALARRAGVVANTWSRWERGDVKPTLDNLPGIAKALGITVSELMED